MIAALVVAAGLIAPEAQAILDQGHWGLITADLSAQSVAQARSCEGTWISFAFGESEVQIIPHEGKAPPSVPPEVYLAVRPAADAADRLEFFSGIADEKPARVYLYDPSVRSLMRLMEDGDGDALYVLCD
ncbi:MAG: hypothetical protein QM698_10335 [Micropepsaceae bacterium]